MALLTRKGTKLEVFSGKKAGLNRVLLQTLENTSPLIAYDVWRQTRKVKDFMHVDSKTAYRRLEALEQEGWIVEKGTRLGKRGGDRTLYEITLQGKAALAVDRKDIEVFLQSANEKQLARFIDAYG